MKYIIIYIFFAFFSQLIIYKWIKKIDKKERKKLQKWEQDYINKMVELREKNNLGGEIEEMEELKDIEDDFLA